MTPALTLANGFKAIKSDKPITIDGKSDESIWEKATSYPIDQIILGENLTKEDFSGSFKLVWDENTLYINAQIQDDILFDQHANPLYKYWDDDCLEIFIDEDNSGGDHQFSFNAFAYHVALDNQAVDFGESIAGKPASPILLNDHIKSVWRRNEKAPHQITWEVAVRIVDDTFQYLAPIEKSLVKLHKGKIMGFMLAYCDNDGSETREHFIGSTYIKPINGDKNLGYKTADVFDTLILIDNK